MFPDNVETITMTKDDYDRNVEQLLLEKLKLEQKCEALEEENKNLKEKVYNILTMTVYGDGKQIKQTAQYKLDIAQQRIDIAISKIDEVFAEEDWYINYEYNDLEYVLKEVKEVLQGSDKK